jgi:hypothetical protein
MDQHLSLGQGRAGKQASHSAIRKMANAIIS